MSSPLQNSKKSLLFSCDSFLKLFKKQQPWKRDVQKWGFWHQLIPFIWDMQLGPFPQVLCLLVIPVDYTDWWVSVERNHWNKYTNLSLNLSLVCQYVCPDKHGPWLFYKLINVWNTEVSPWKKIHLSLTLFKKSLHHPVTASETLPGFIFTLTLSVVICSHDLITVYFSYHSSLFLDHFLSKDIWLPSLVLAWGLIAISIQNCSPFSKLSKVLFQPVSLALQPTIFSPSYSVSKVFTSFLPSFLTRAYFIMFTALGFSPKGKHCTLLLINQSPCYTRRAPGFCPGCVDISLPGHLPPPPTYCLLSDPLALKARKGLWLY